MELEIHSPAEWADVVAADLAAILGDPAGPRVCLPSGATPAPVYERVPGELNARGQDAGRATVVLLDEYVGLPPADPARCDRQLRSQLIDRLDPAPTFVAIPVDTLDPEGAAARVDAAAEGLDLAVVGLGLNGHVGMNEPGSDPRSPTRVVTITPSTARTATEQYGASRSPTAGVTLGLDRLLAAREIWLLATGSAKAQILAEVLDGPITEDRPASFLRGHPRLRVIADLPAAARLTAAPVHDRPHAPDVLG